MYKKYLSIEEYQKFLSNAKYGNRIDLNVIMCLLIDKHNDLCEDFMEEYLSDKKDLKSLLFLVPKAKEYQDLHKKIVVKLFGTKGFEVTLIIEFLRHFTECPEILKIYLELERIRLYNVEHASFG